MGIGSFLLVALVGYIAMGVAVCQRNKTNRTVLTVLSILTMLGSGGTAVCLGKKHMDRSNYISACRTIVKTNADAALVAECRPHLAKIDAEEATQKAEWQAQKERDNAETIRAHRP